MKGILLMYYSIFSVCKNTAKTPPFLAQLFRAFAALRITQGIQKVSSQQPGKLLLLYRLVLGLFWG
jgi:hypothetical protein